MQRISEVSDQFMFIINSQHEMQIKELIEMDSCLPPPEYIQYSINEFQKLPVFDNDDIITYIRIPDFGIADFDNLNKINKIYPAIKIQQDLKSLINWINSTSFYQSKPKILKDTIIKIKKLYIPFRNNLNVNIYYLSTLANQNYINDSIIKNF